MDFKPVEEVTEKEAFWCLVKFVALPLFAGVVFDEVLALIVKEIKEAREEKKANEDLKQLVKEIKEAKEAEKTVDRDFLYEII